MTRDDAIRILEDQLNYSDDVIPGTVRDAYKVAIDSIKELQTIYFGKGRVDALDELTNRTKEILGFPKPNPDELTATALQKEYMNGYLAGKRETYDDCDVALRELSDIKTGCSVWLEEHDAKVRADAIEEFYNKIKNRLSDVENAIVEQQNSVSFISKSEILIGMKISIEDFLGWLSDNIEQLKEYGE